MRNRSATIAVALLLCFLMLSSGCATHDSDREEYSETSYTGQYHTTNDKIRYSNSDNRPIYIDRAVLAKSDSITPEQSEIMTRTQDYLETLSWCYRGQYRPVGLEGDISTDNGLAGELGVRSLYVARVEAKRKFDKDALFITYKDLEFTPIEGDGMAAKVIVEWSLRGENGKEDITRQEGYVFKRENDQWIMTNAVFDSDGGDSAALDRLAASTDASEWLTTYSYEQFKRSDYEPYPDYSAFLDENGGIVWNRVAEQYGRFYALRSRLGAFVREWWNNVAGQSWG